jgi:hypothetical protein
MGVLQREFGARKSEIGNAEHSVLNVVTDLDVAHNPKVIGTRNICEGT